MIDGTVELELFRALGGVEVLRAELHGLVLLAVGAGEHHDVAAHLGGELDGQVAETSDTHDTDLRNV